MCQSKTASKAVTKNGHGEKQHRSEFELKNVTKAIVKCELVER